MKHLNLLVLFSSTVIFSIPELLAQTCAQKPDCAELGYVQTEEECNGLNFIRCPFNKNTVYCGGDTCRYTSTTLPQNCLTADSCIIETTTYYSDSCSACSSGYELSGGSCVCNSDNSCLGSYRGSCDGTIDASTKDGCGNTCYYCEVVHSYPHTSYSASCWLGGTTWRCSCNIYYDKGYSTDYSAIYFGIGASTQSECEAECEPNCVTEYNRGYTTKTSRYLIK